MSLIIVDQEKCKRDGACIAECPAELIEFRKEKGFPAHVPNADELCIRCGHCVAVCPHGAMTHRDMPANQCPPLRDDWPPDVEWVAHFLRGRRSIRSYKSRVVQRKVLRKLVDIARFAPSGHNRQPVRWLIIEKCEEVRRLAGITIDWMQWMLKQQPDVAKSGHMDFVVNAWQHGKDRVCRGAPHLVVVHAPKEERTAPTACTLALAYLELAAPSMGLGACWAGFVNAAASIWPPLKEALALPERHTNFGVMMIGHPKYRYYRLPLRKEAEISWR